MSDLKEKEYLLVGVLGRPHGLSGEILMDVQTDFPERIVSGVRVFCGQNHRPVVFDRVRGHNKGLLIGVQGVTSPEEAGKYRNTPVFVLASDRPALPDGQYYHHQILGLSVQTEDGQPLGRVTEVLKTGANDVFVVKNESGQEVLLPNIPSVILDVDLSAKTIRVHLLPGLVSEPTSSQ